MPQPQTSDPDRAERSVAPDLRLRRRIRMKNLLQSEALALFAARGYHQTSIDDIAHAAAISPRTFYRYYACKEDVVLWDEYDELPPQELWDARAGEDVFTLMVRRLRELTAQLYSQDRARLLARTKLSYAVPEIRARFVSQQVDMIGPYYLQLTDALGVPSDDLHLAVTMAAAFSAVLVAMEHWQRHDGEEELPLLIDEAIAALTSITPRR